MVLIDLQIAQEEQELREPPADVDRGQCNPPAIFAYFHPTHPSLKLFSYSQHLQRSQP